MHAVLRPDAPGLNLAALKRTFAICFNEGFVEILAARLVVAVAAQVLHVLPRSLPKPDKGVRVLREGAVDLEIGVLGESEPEIYVQVIFRDHSVGVVRHGHPLLEKGQDPLRALCGMRPRR